MTPDQITKLKDRMTTRVIRQQQTSPTKITPVFSQKFDMSGMFVDNGMEAQKMRLQAIEKERIKAIRHLKKHRIKQTMLAILRVNYGFK